MTKKIVLFFVLAFAFPWLSAVASDGSTRIYQIPLSYNQGKVNFGEIITSTGYAPQYAPAAALGDNEYLIELVSFGGQTLERHNFIFPSGYLRPFMGVPTEVKNTDQLIIFPYHKDGKTLNVYDSVKKLILTKDIGYLADMCGDGVCQNQESYADCPKDCPAAGQDGYCNPQESVNDPDCPNYNNQKAVNNPAKTAVKTGSIFSGRFVLVSFLVIFLIIVIAIYFYIIYRRRNRD